MTHKQINIYFLFIEIEYGNREVLKTFTHIVQYYTN